MSTDYDCRLGDREKRTDILANEKSARVHSLEIKLPPFAILTEEACCYLPVTQWHLFLSGTCGGSYESKVYNLK